MDEIADAALRATTRAAGLSRAESQERRARPPFQRRLRQRGVPRPSSSHALLNAPTQSAPPGRCIGFLKEPWSMPCSPIDLMGRLRLL